MTQTSNGFERHGIDHLSASSINLWSSAPDVWLMSYLVALEAVRSVRHAP